MGGVYSIVRIALVGALVACPACTWFDRRLTDLGDCCVWRWHEEACGVAVDAKVGPLAAAVGGYYADWGVGKDTWWQRPGYTLTNHVTGVPFTTLGPLAYGQSWSRLFATGSRGNHPADPNAFDDVTSWILLTDAFDLDGEGRFALTPEQRVVDAFGVEIGVAPLIVAAHVGFNVAEFADFALGLIGLDPFGDDGVPRPPTLPYVPGAGR